MDPTDIGKAYNKITHIWESEDFNRSNGIRQHEKAILFAENHGPALDVGCGCTGRFIDLLLDRGFTPEGVDISGEMINLARQRHPDIQFYHADICHWEIPRKYDLITAWDSIWHVPLEQQEHVITRIVESLNKGGIFIFSFGGTDEPGDHRNSFMGPEVYYSSLGTNGFLSLLMKLGCVCKHLEYDQHPELHTYMIVQKL
ncbi:class I SAM-dependent methyltransferase [Endozoicomonadaceae bacterium StTr2]